MEWLQGSHWQRLRWERYADDRRRCRALMRQARQRVLARRAAKAWEGAAASVAGLTAAARELGDAFAETGAAFAPLGQMLEDVPDYERRQDRIRIAVLLVVLAAVIVWGLA